MNCHDDFTFPPQQGSKCVGGVEKINPASVELSVQEPLIPGVMWIPGNNDGFAESRLCYIHRQIGRPGDEHRELVLHLALHHARQEIECVPADAAYRVVPISCVDSYCRDHAFAGLGTCPADSIPSPAL